MKSGTKGPGKIGWGGVFALVLGATALGVTAYQFTFVAGSLFAPAAKESVSKQDERLAESEQKYAAAIDEQVAQVSGRSLFFVPGAPVPPPPKPPPTPDPGPEPPPPPPSSYGGPPVIGMVNDSVWFSDGTRLKVGEAPEGAGVKVLAVEPPWGAKVLWKGVEFSVSLFDRDKVIVKAPGEATDAPTTEAADSDGDKKDDDAKADDKSKADPKKPDDASKPATPNTDPKADPNSPPKPADPANPDAKPDAKPDAPKQDTPPSPGTPAAPPKGSASGGSD